MMGEGPLLEEESRDKDEEGPCFKLEGEREGGKEGRSEKGRREGVREEGREGGNE